MAADDLESLRETVFWLQQAQVRDDLDAGEDEYATGQTFSADQLRARHGLPVS